MPITRPLIAVDLSDAGEATTRWTANIVPAGTTVVLGHAVDVPEPPGFLRDLFPDTDAVVALAEQGARRELTALAARVPIPDVVCDVRAGRAVDVLLQIAEDRGVDSIVLGPHGAREGLGQVIGSTAVKLARQSAVPVIVVRGPSVARKPARLLVAIDESFASAAALRWAALFAVDMGASLHVCTVVPPLLTNALSIAATDAERADAMRQVTDATALWLDEIVAAVPEVRPTMTSSVHLGRPADVITALADAQAADLVVVGRNAGGIANMLLGSVADAILRHGATSTAVIPG